MTKRYISPIENGRVRLRLLEQRDLPLTLAWRNQEQIRKWFFFSDIIAPEQHRAWFDLYRTRNDDFVFVIEDVWSIYRPVGQVAVYGIDWQARRGEFGRLMIGEADARGKGFANEATRLITSMAFDMLGLNEVYLAVLNDNVSAIKTYLACGFEEIGRDGTSIQMARTARRVVAA